MAEIQSDRHIRIVNEYPVGIKLRDDKKYEIVFTKHEKIIANHAAWSSSPGDLLQVLGLDKCVKNYEKCSFILAFVRVPTDFIKLDFTVLTIVDPGIMSYRITNQSRCSAFDSGHSRIVMEINSDYLAENAGMKPMRDLKSLVIQELILLGIIEDGSCVYVDKVIELNNVLLLPNANSLASHTDEMTVIHEVVPSMYLLGASSGFFSSSFNNQILQGLKICEDWIGC